MDAALTGGAATVAEGPSAQDHQQQDHEVHHRRGRGLVRQKHREGGEIVSHGALKSNPRAAGRKV